MKALSPDIVTDENNFSFSHIEIEGSWSKVNYQSVSERKTHGNYHQKDESELFIIIKGKVQVSIKDAYTQKSRSFIAKCGDKFIIEPNETYNLYTLEKCEWLNLVSTYTNEAVSPTPKYSTRVYDLLSFAA